MHTNIRRAIGVIAAVSALGMTTPAWSESNDRGDHWRDRREDRREEWRDGRERWQERRDSQWRRAAERRELERREWDHRRELERHRAAAYWRFERDRGWRFEHRPGVWSPHFVWWAAAGGPILRPFPTARIVRYTTGYYELLGDGFTVPYHWVWRPTVVVATPPPPVPLTPPPLAGYPFPPGGMYPAPPAG